MSDPIFTIPNPPDGFVGAPASDKAAQDAKFYGEDIWYDMASADPITGKADYVVTASGDWAMATKLEALRQSLLRRLLTNPGEWQTVPDYGVGARQYVKAAATKANLAELESRIRSQFMRDDRVESVSQVLIERIDGPGIKVSVFVIAAGRLRQDAPLPVLIEIR